VFTPTLLTILGVIMYLRLGWTVGNAGLLGGLGVILLALAITTATALSISSIATNTRLGAGGPYAIISRSLGLEVGGSVALPLYLCQALAVTMYIFGFRAGWMWFFPDHQPLLVDLGSFAAIFSLAYVSADLAFRIQYVIMAVIAGSLILIFASPAPFEATHSPALWGTYPGAPESSFDGTNFWGVFAVFFPAATGILAGVNMSGELADPRRGIPRGTLSAVAVSALVYVLLAIWLAFAASPTELVGQYEVLLQKSLWPPGVALGLLGATFSSGLTSMVGGPRILAALGRDKLVPGAERLAVPRGEPRLALAVTGVLVLLTLLLRDLNVVAPLITMFFLLTYALINVVVLIEQSLGLASFRPTLAIPLFVPLVGAVGSVFAMFIVSPTFSLIAVGVVVAIFVWMQALRLETQTADVRSGIFSAFAQWAAAKVITYEMADTRAWKPNLLVPVECPEVLRGQFRILVDLCAPEGSARLLGLATDETTEELTPRLLRASRELRQNRVLTTWSVVDCTDFPTGVIAGLQALRGTLFVPNVLFLGLPGAGAGLIDTQRVVDEGRRLRVGLAVLALHAQSGLGRERVVNLYVKPRLDLGSPMHLLRGRRLNLAVLLAYRVAGAWSAELNVVSVVGAGHDVPAVHRWLAELHDLCRLPGSARSHVLVGAFPDAITHAPQSDLDVMAFPENRNLEFAREMVRQTRSSCLFAADSGYESALA